MNALERFVCEQNIVQFRAKLASETDRAKRAVLVELLRREEAKLEGAEEPRAAAAPETVRRNRNL
jgi:hypothetical protein